LFLRRLDQKEGRFQLFAGMTKNRGFGGTGSANVSFDGLGARLRAPIPGKTMIEPLTAPAFKSPAIALWGAVDDAMYNNFRAQLANAPAEGLVVVELSTLGGDPEVARMMGEDIRYYSELEPGRRFVFLGKAAIYSAGTTFMSFFARCNRYLTRGTRLMIHERKLIKTIALDGPLSTLVANVEATLNEIRASIEIQNEGFAHLIQGSSVGMDELLRRAPSNWYIEAQEAKKLGLIEDVL
jgi:ATP-dependent protease ClpP protease subunit